MPDQLSQELHKKYCSYTESFIAKCSQNQITGKLIETRKIVLNESNDQSNNYSVVFSNDNDSKQHYGYTNMRFVGDYNKIEFIELNMNGSIIDKIYPYSNKMMTSFSILDKNILPAVCFHKYQIKTKQSGNLEIIYDVVQIDNPSDSYEFVFSQTQFSGPKDTNIIETYFLYPVTKITVVSKYPISNVCMDLNDTHLSLNKLDDYTYQYIFDPSVNFSRIKQNIRFDKVNQDDKIEVGIFAQSLNVGRII